MHNKFNYQSEEIARLKDEINILKGEKKRPVFKPSKLSLVSRFDTLFTQNTRYETLNQLLKRIHQNKTELLLVLNRLDIPLHTNGSETDIRDFVKKQKLRGGTRSDEDPKVLGYVYQSQENMPKIGRVILVIFN